MKRYRVEFKLSDGHVTIMDDVTRDDLDRMGKVIEAKENIWLHNKDTSLITVVPARAIIRMVATPEKQDG